MRGTGHPMSDTRNSPKTRASGSPMTSRSVGGAVGDVCDTLARLLLQHIHDFARTDLRGG